MVSQGRGRLYRRKDGKYLIYIPVKLCEDSMSPFNPAWGDQIKPDSDVYVKISFKMSGDKLLVERWKDA